MKKYAALFKRAGCKDITEKYKKPRYEHRLFVSKRDFNIMTNTATKIQRSLGTDGNLFDKCYIMVHNSDAGYIPEEFLNNKPTTPLIDRNNVL